MAVAKAGEFGRSALAGRHVGFVLLLVADEPVLEDRLLLRGSSAAQGPVGFVDIAVPEHGAEPFEGLARLGEKDDAADRTVDPVGDAEKDLAGLRVPLRDEGLERLGEGLVTGFVALGDLPDPFVENEQVVVLIQDAGRDVGIFRLAELSVNHGVCHIFGKDSDNLAENRRWHEVR